MKRLEQLVMAVNDLMESRIDANLKIALLAAEGSKFNVSGLEFSLSIWGIRFWIHSIVASCAV